MSSRAASAATSSRQSGPILPGSQARHSGARSGRRVVSSSDEGEGAEAAAAGPVLASQTATGTKRRRSDDDVDELEADADDVVDTPIQPTAAGPSTVKRGLKLKLRFQAPVAVTSEAPVALARAKADRSDKKRPRAAKVNADLMDEEIDELADEDLLQDDDDAEGEDQVNPDSASEDEHTGFGGGHTGTARQRARQSAAFGEALLELPPEPIKKEALTDLERANKREENARRRKLQADQKQETDKTEAINRLLKASSGRSRTKLQIVVNGDVEASREGSPALDGREAGEEGQLANSGPRADTYRFISTIRSGDFAMTLHIPETETGLFGGPPPPLATNGSKCSVSSCHESRKYRSVRRFHEGACSMEHLKRFEMELVESECAHTELMGV